MFNCVTNQSQKPTVCDFLPLKNLWGLMNHLVSIVSPRQRGPFKREAELFNSLVLLKGPTKCGRWFSQPGVMCAPLPGSGSLGCRAWHGVEIPMILSRNLCSWEFPPESQPLPTSVRTAIFLSPLFFPSLDGACSLNPWLSDFWAATLQMVIQVDCFLF